MYRCVYVCVCVCMHAWYSLVESVCTRGRGLLGWLHANTHLHTPRTWSFCANSSALVFPFASYPPLSSTQSGKRKKSASSPYSARQAAHETCSNGARREKAHLSYMIKRAPGQDASFQDRGKGGFQDMSGRALMLLRIYFGPQQLQQQRRRRLSITLRRLSTFPHDSYNSCSPRWFILNH